jgi:hypothetical protein
VFGVQVMAAVGILLPEGTDVGGVTLGALVDTINTDPMILQRAAQHVVQVNTTAIRVNICASASTPTP